MNAVAYDIPRSHKRVTLPTGVNVIFPTFKSLVANTALNISEGGMFVKSDQLLDIGTEIDLQLRVKDDEPVIKARCVVLRNTIDEESGSPGMAVKFVELSENSRKLIKRIVAERPPEIIY